MRSEVPPFLGCSLHKKCHGYPLCKQAQAVSPSHQHALSILDPSLAVDLHCAGLDLSFASLVAGLPVFWTANLESRNLDQAPLLTESRMMCCIQTSGVQGSSNISTDGEVYQ
jgi:hypothetical protein